MARPMPLEAPVTTARLSFNRISASRFLESAAQTSTRRELPAGNAALRSRDDVLPSSARRPVVSGLAWRCTMMVRHLLTLAFAGTLLAPACWAAEEDEGCAHRA
ncbi:MAG: hypothetical protein KDC48_11820, partial [Planctomycetes bacterium]|nr:hypothetical protein [Planctomycetota bacterium]